MNLTKLFRIAAVSFAAALGFASPSHAGVTNIFFSAGANCSGAPTAAFSPGGPTVTFSLCMTADSTGVTAPATPASCGHTTVLQAAAAAGSGKFVVTSYANSLSFDDPNSAVAPVPLSINDSTSLIIADLGATGSGPIAFGTNQLLVTFTVQPQATATASSYAIGLASTSIVATDKDGACGSTTVPGEVTMNTVPASPPVFTLTFNNAPVFTTPASVTFQAGASNTFTPMATGNPTPTITMPVGTVPGMSFTGGALTGVPTTTGTFSVTFRAAGAGTTDQLFQVTVGGKASQVITFINPPQSQVFSSTPITLTATASPSLLPVTLTTGSAPICSVSGNSVTMLNLGTCIINANQGGDLTYLPAPQVQHSFSIQGSVPGAPTGLSVSNGSGQATISFSAPASTGGTPILGYTANCGAFSGSGIASPITVTGLTNGQTYSCTVVATNLLGTGPASAPATANPTAVALALIGVQSRKIHGSAGPFDLPISTAVGAVTIEPRGALAANLANHSVVFQFNGPVTTAGSATSLNGASAAVGTVGTVTASGNEVTVPLTGVLNQSRAVITLSGVVGPGGTTGGVVTIGFLSGDVAAPFGDSNGSIDIIAVKVGAKSGSVTSANYLADLNVDGTVGAVDIIIAKLRNGKPLLP